MAAARAWERKREGVGGSRRMRAVCSGDLIGKLWARIQHLGGGKLVFGCRENE